MKSQTVNKGRPDLDCIIQYVTYIVQLSVKTNSIIQYIYNRRLYLLAIRITTYTKYIPCTTCDTVYTYLPNMFTLLNEREAMIQI